MIKLIASDMDGTLISSNHAVSPVNVQAIQEAQAKGVEFIISTGRNFADARSQIEAAGLVCNYLVMNGGELRDSTGAILLKHYLDELLVKQLVNELLSYDLCVEIYSSGGLFAIGSTEACRLAVAAKVNNFFPELSVESVYQTAEEHFLYKELVRIDYLSEIFDKGYEVGKLIAFTPDTELVANLREKIPGTYPVNATGSFAINLEITSPLADKGQALKNYAQSKGVALCEIMTLGDSFNDMTMFDPQFGYTVAMGNAIPEIKEIAKYITDTNDQDGVAKAIQKFIK